MNFFIVKQLPVLPPSTYTASLTDFIAPRVIELTYTAWDLEPFARDGFLGFTPTSVELGILLCWHHHDWVHAHGITIARSKGEWFFYDRHGWLIEAPQSDEGTGVPSAG